MYILTCPKCNNESKVKRARVGATATCVKCSSLYQVDESSMREEGGAAPVAAAPSAAAPQVPEKARIVETLSANENPTPMEALANVARSVSDVNEETEAERAAGVVAEIEAEFATDGSGDSRPSHWQRQLPRRSGNKLLFPILIVFAILLGGVLVFVLSSGDDETPDIATGPSTDPGGDPGPETDGGKPTPPPDGGKPTPPDPMPKTPTQTKDGGKTEVKPPPMLPVPMGPPTLDLQRVPAGKWTQPFTPAPPIAAKANSDVVRWDSGTFDSPGGPSVLVGQFIGKAPRIFKNGMLHVDVLNGAGKTILRMSQFIPVVSGGEGLDVRVALPASVKPKSKNVVAVFEPQNPLAKGVPLVLDEAAIKVVESDGKSKTLEMGLRNQTGDQIASNPVVAIELLDVNGAPLATWHGKLEGTRIEPGQTALFRVVLPVPEDVKSGRLTVRGYGEQFP